MNKKEFLKTQAVKKQINWLNAAGIICIILSVVQLIVILTGTSIITVSVIDTIILFAIGIALLVTRHRFAAWAMLIVSIINMVAVSMLTDTFGGWLYVIVGVSAVRSAYEIDKMWKEYCEQNPAGTEKAAAKRVSDSVNTPAPSIDPAAIAAYRPTGTLTTVLASPDDPAPYQAPYPQDAAVQEIPPAYAASSHAQYQEPAPAPAVAPAAPVYEPAPAVAPAAPVYEPAPAVAPAASVHEPAPAVGQEAAHAEASEPDTVMIPELHEEKQEESNEAAQEEGNTSAEIAEDLPAMIPDEEDIQETEEAEPEEESQEIAETEKQVIYGYKIIKEGLYGYHYFDGKKAVCTIEGANASNTPVSIQGGGEHWYCINDWGIRVMPGQRKYIINYADEMTNGILEYKERDHFVMNYKAESLEAVNDGDVMTFFSDGREVACITRERGTYAFEGMEGYSYADDIRMKLNIDSSVGVIRNLIMAFPLLYFG